MVYRGRIENGRIELASEVELPEGLEVRVEVIEPGLPSDPAANVDRYPGRPIWEVAAAIGASLPEEAWEKVPADLSKNLDHYLYGAPRQEE